MRTLEVFAVATLTLAVPAGANAQTAGALTPAECQTAATALANRSPSWQWEGLATCGAAGAQAFKTALIAARLTSDTAFLSDLSSRAAWVRDAGLLQTAMQLAEDTGATTAARVAALLTALSQYEAGIGPRGRTFSELVSKPIGSFCVMRAPMGANYLSDLGVTVADRQSASIRSAELAFNSSNVVIRELARCVSEYIAFDVPVSVDPQLITMEYVCGTKFRVRNAGTKLVEVSFLGFRAQAGGTLNVPARGETLIITHCVCGLELFYQGRAIRSVLNGGTPC